MPRRIHHAFESAICIFWTRYKPNLQIAKSIASKAMAPKYMNVESSTSVAMPLIARHDNVKLKKCTWHPKPASPLMDTILTYTSTHVQFAKAHKPLVQLPNQTEKSFTASSESNANKTALPFTCIKSQGMWIWKSCKHMITSFLNWPLWACISQEHGSATFLLVADLYNHSSTGGASIFLPLAT